VVSVGLFLVAYFGSDGSNRVSTGAVAASRYLDEHGQPGAVLYLDENFPDSIGARYAQFYPRTFLLERVGKPGTVLTARELPDITGIAQQDAATSSTAYLVVSDSMLVYAHAYGLASSRSLAPLKRALDRSPDWRVFYHGGDTIVYQIRPTPNT
jgi:hypothetical protein